MSKPVIFYYSRRKLGLYLLLNLFLLALAGLFTWLIFPNYSLVYGYALIACILSLLASLIVFVFPMKLAVLDDERIKIDHNEPLLWSQIKKIEKDGAVCCGVNRAILRIVPQKLTNYHKSLMQKITDSSRFGMFSIPLYAMDEKAAIKITRLIEERVTHDKIPLAPKTAKKHTKSSSAKTAAKKTPKKPTKPQQSKNKKIKAITKKR